MDVFQKWICFRTMGKGPMDVGKVVKDLDATFINIAEQLSRVDGSTKKILWKCWNMWNCTLCHCQHYVSLMEERASECW